MTPPDTARAALRRLAALILAGSLTGLALGSANLVVWVEDWPPGPLTDRALAGAHGWHDWMGRLGLDRVHPAIRAAERAVESFGAPDEGR